MSFCLSGLRSTSFAHERLVTSCGCTISSRFGPAARAFIFKAIACDGSKEINDIIAWKRRKRKAGPVRACQASNHDRRHQLKLGGKLLSFCGLVLQHLPRLLEVEYVVLQSLFMVRHATLPPSVCMAQCSGNERCMMLLASPSPTLKCHKISTSGAP